MSVESLHGTVCLKGIQKLKRDLVSYAQYFFLLVLRKTHILQL